MRNWMVLGAFLALLVIAACSPERKLAKEYIAKSKRNGVLVMPLYELFKENHSINYDTTIAYTAEQFDSMAWAQSNYVKNISDSVFLTRFTNSMVNELTAFGYDVSVENPDYYLSLPDPKWMITINQLAMCESYSYEEYPVSVFESQNEWVKINKVSLASWLDVSNANTNFNKTLTLEGYISDKVISQGLADGFEMGLLRDTVKLKDVYNMADDLGKVHGKLLYDYFMNRYIKEHMPNNTRQPYKVHYDRQRNKITVGVPTLFKEMDWK